MLLRPITALITGSFAALLALGGCQKGPDQTTTPWSEDDDRATVEATPEPVEPALPVTRRASEPDERVSPSRPGGPAASTPGAAQIEAVAVEVVPADKVVFSEPTVIEVEVPGEMAVQCEMGPKHVYFEYDSKEPGKLAQQKLNDIARCLTEGKLAGREVFVVGYADPRGSDQYNRELAAQRARAVVDALQEQGVKEARTEVMSMGEAAARDAKAAYAWSRRATIRTLPAGE